MTFEMNSGPGKSTAFQTEGGHRPLWEVAWESAEVAFQSEGGSVGALKQAKGALFQDGEKVSEFSAGRAVAQQKEKRLTLSDGIEIRALKFDAAMVCDSIVWDASGPWIKARGRVRFAGEAVPLTLTYDEIWASPDLSRIATPDMLDESEKNR